ncbi:ATP-binding cassette domain-containing protein [Gulosibacter sp. GYB002]|uniref:ABC transporter ATP-binding protein n=1 Tax=Gulosibacter sp. GYB002 TaxID=2994391 RepID=UPI002F96C456
MISVRNLDLVIAGRRIISGLDLDIADGRSVALIGASGSGKTTLLNVLSLILRPTAGDLTIDGERLERPSDRRRQRFWRERAAFVLQNYGLIDDETAGYNVMLSDPPLRKHRATTNPAVLDALDRVGLRERVASPVAQLSGGEQQRVGIARALFKNAEYVFADEPTASLDAENRARVAELLLQPGDRARTVVVATHDLELARRCDEIVDLTPSGANATESDAPA